MARATFGQAVKAAAAASPIRQKPEELPAGTHTATVVAGNVQPTLAGDSHRLGLRFVADSGPEVGKSAWNSQMLRLQDELNVSIFARMCEALKIDVEKVLGAYDLGDPDVDLDDHKEKVRILLERVSELAQGVRVQVKVVVKPDRQGRMRTEVQFVNPLPSDAPPSQLDQAKKGVASMAAAIGKPAAVKPAGAAKPTRPAI